MEKDYSWVGCLIYLLVVIAVIVWMFVGKHSSNVWEDVPMPPYP